MNQIYRNFAGSEEYSEESFIAKLHEENVWNDDEYFKLENALYELCEANKGKEVIHRDVAWPVMRVFSYLMISLSCQYDENDSFEVKYLTRAQYYARRERLQLVFEGFFKGQMPSRKHLNY